MLKNHIKPVSRKSDIVVQDFGNEILIYDLKENKAFSLNKTSAMIWQFCDGQKTVSDIARNMSGKLDSTVTEDFVWLALEQLKRDKLLENGSEIPSDFGGLSRREAIRKVGFATLVALPLVSSLVAPTSAHAQSLNCSATPYPNGCACTALAQCRTGCCSRVPGQPRTCVTANQGATGTACGVNCDCVGSCCVSGICSADTVNSGGACANTCQCVGASTCSAGTCT
ncbi:MAG: PqqD family protein [Pyrinomonadaceae bacterium]